MLLSEFCCFGLLLLAQGHLKPLFLQQYFLSKPIHSIQQIHVVSISSCKSNIDNIILRLLGEINTLSVITGVKLELVDHDGFQSFPENCSQNLFFALEKLISRYILQFDGEVIHLQSLIFERICELVLLFVEEKDEPNIN